MHDAESATAPERRPRADGAAGGGVDAPGHVVAVADGRSLVRVVAGPRGARDVLLLHGIGLTADANWARAYGPLSSHVRVIAPDHRGHGAGPAVAGPVTLECLADDAATVLRELGRGPATVVGYSLGGLVAQLLWRRHPELVEAMVLCSTAAGGLMSPVERLVAVASYGTAATTRFGAAFVRSQMQLVWPSVIGTGDGDGLHSRVRAAVRVVDPAAVAGVALAVGDFDSRSWLAEIDVPCVVMVTAQDRLVPAERQREMAALIPGADVAEVHGDHSFCLTHPDGFVPVLVDLCRSVRAARGRGGR